MPKHASSLVRPMMVVGIGASAGGLDAITRLVKTLPSTSPMALLLVQHLEPFQPSLMVELLQPHAAIPVRQAADGLALQPGHLYVTPPGTILRVADGRMHVSRNGLHEGSHGARLPFDALLQSMAASYAERAACIVLSGTGADGSAGAKTIAQGGGLVIAQDPLDAAHEGMPRNAIHTGAVDLILPVDAMTAALFRFERQMVRLHAASMQAPPATPEQDPLPDIVELLRAKTAHDFSLYKRGTLQRRIERRMAMATIEAHGMDDYLDVLRRDPAELDVLANSLLINVTSFFRNPGVFDTLAERIVPDIVSGHALDQPVRIWVAGCSSGEETYSLAMVFLEQIAAHQAGVRLQVFASDVDPGAVAAAREGLYPSSIETEVSSARLRRFFTNEDGRYRVSPELRACVVFTVQDVLADPPFSRLDLVSCRNLLIYLQPEAQIKVISLFHFALREGGILLLGNSETVGAGDDRFEVIAKPERLYRHVGRSRPGEFGFLMRGADGMRVKAMDMPGKSPVRQAGLAELSRRLVLEAHGPAAVLINRQIEWLYSMGPIGRYLQIAAGHPTHDLLAMIRPGLRATLRAAIRRAIDEGTRIVTPCGRTKEGTPFDVDVLPVARTEARFADDLLLICFIDRPTAAQPGAMSQPGMPAASPPLRTLELEQELETTRGELQSAIRDLEISTEEQKAINEEALSVNEEYQSTNEELLTSKEELQSLNEELTALNSQLQETLERQRTASDDLQNVLYSTDVATLFLDPSLAIRFFTPATRALFNLIPGDIGRPLTDLHSLSTDTSLMTDARAVLSGTAAPDREIDTGNGASFMRRILPYRSRLNGPEGVVITFIDVSERNRVRQELRGAVRQAEQANAAKSRFLASASHDLRQPLQTLTLINGLLAPLVVGVRAQQLVARFDRTLGSMTGMLDTLLDINQIDSGSVRVEIVDLPVGPLLQRLRDEFALHAEAKGLTFHVVASTRIVRSDLALLEQILRNLISNALKYTTKGSVLLGCRHDRGKLRIEVWDTGIGIQADKIDDVFEEYRQIDNAAGERNRGLGLGLAIVRRLGALLGHPIRVQSWFRHGSVFSVEVPVVESPTRPDQTRPAPEPALGGLVAEAPAQRTGAILLVEDELDLAALLAEYLTSLGHHVVTAENGAAALALMAEGAIRPDLVLADYKLPGLMNGLQLGTALRTTLGVGLPIVILTGDISTDTLADVAAGRCVKLNKPVQLDALASLIQQLLPAHDVPHDLAGVVHVVDDDQHVREAIAALLAQEGRRCVTYASCETFLTAFQPAPGQCLVVDANLPGLCGLDLIRQLRAAGHDVPSILMTGSGDITRVVEAMTAGASDFLEKPIAGADLLASITRALGLGRGSDARLAWERQATAQLASLTSRQRQIMTLVLDGQPSKNIAADLNISQRTVENHRAAIMHKTGSASLPALARLAMAAASTTGTGRPGSAAVDAAQTLTTAPRRTEPEHA